MTVEAVRLAGRLPYVAKSRIREAMLNKPGTLTADECAHVHQRLAIGVDILPPFTHLGEFPTYLHHHHERWDGSGCPQRLAGKRYPMAAAFSALSVPMTR